MDKWKGYTGNGRCVAFSPDGNGLVSGGDNGILRYWDVSSLAGMETGKGQMRIQQIRIFEGHMARNFLAFDSLSVNVIFTGYGSFCLIFARQSMGCLGFSF